MGVFVQGDVHGVLRDELGLRRHDGAAAAALGQLVFGPFPQIHIVDAGQNHGLHKAFDKGGLACAHRPHHADIDIPFGAKGDILINAALFHCYSSLRMFVSQR